MEHQLALHRRAAPLRVALFSGNYNMVRDGANQALNRLVRHLIDEAGAAVRVYSPVTDRPAFPPQGDLVGVRSLGIPRRPEYRVSLGLSDRTREDIRRFAPTVVHLSAPDPLGAQAQIFARALKVPVVTSLHTRFETYLDYYGLGFLKGWLTRYLGRFYRNSDLVLVPNAPLAESMAGQGLEGRIRVWGRGVDRAIFHPSRRSEAFRAAHGYAPDDVAVLFFGRLVKEKGLDRFAEAVGAVRATGRRVRPLIVGDGPARDWLAGRLPHASFLGQLAGPALGEAVASADILYNPSLTEAFGNVTLEAMAAGLAVVCPEVASTRPLVRTGVDGVLLPVGTRSPGVRDVLCRLIDDRGERQRLARAAADRSAAFTWAAANDTVVAAYRDALALRRAA